MPEKQICSDRHAYSPPGLASKSARIIPREFCVIFCFVQTDLDEPFANVIAGTNWMRAHAGPL
jgi:hypothetical protein